MSKRTHRKNDLVLAIAPSSRGFGFAVMEGMITLYNPAVLMLEDAPAKGSRRSRRIRNVTKKIIATAASRQAEVALLSRDQVMRAFFKDGIGSKHTIARILAMRFPEELGHRLPPKRKPWRSEDYRTGIFDAVALAVAKQLWQE